MLQDCKGHLWASGFEELTLKGKGFVPATSAN